MTYQELIKKLSKGENFSFSRWGDGEFNAILGAAKGQDHKANCDGHRYFTDMGLRLYKVIKSKPRYVMGLQSLAVRLRGEDPDFKELIDGIDWVDSDIIHRQSIRTNGNLSDLFDVLKQRDIILVANENLIPLTMPLYKYSLLDEHSNTSFHHILISPKDCWLEYADILKRLRELITKDVVILYCSSMASEVLIDDIYNDYGDAVTQIDIGSAFDPFIGANTRSYHRNLKI